MGVQYGVPFHIGSLISCQVARCFDFSGGEERLSFSQAHYMPTVPINATYLLWDPANVGAPVGGSVSFVDRLGFY